ncbi:MAG: AMP-binding protein, partial [Candidatus Binatia bacterium]
MSSVTRLIHDLAARHGARPALIDMAWDATTGGFRRGASISYADLYDRTLRLVDALAARGVRPGDRVAVLLDNSVELVVSEWACLVSGMVWVALNVRSSPSEQTAILRDCAASVLIVSSRYRRVVDLATLGDSCTIVEVGAGGDWDRLLASGAPRLPAQE